MSTTEFSKLGNSDDECLLSPLHGTVYNIVEELFGLRHDGQVHVSSLFPNSKA
jgi:hypothetical protein